MLGHPMFRMSALAAAVKQAAAQTTKTYRQLVLDASPQAYWRLDDSGTTAVDETGTHDGTYNGTYTQGVGPAQAGGSPSAVDFAGGYVDTPYSGPLSTEAMTLLCWVYFDTAPTDATQTLIDGNELSNTGTGNSWVLRSSSAGGIEIAGVAFGSSLGTGAVNTGQWYFVAVSHDGDGAQCRIYLDAVETAAGARSLPHNDDGIRLARRGAARDDRALDGRLDEVAVFNTALSAAKIQELYNRSLETIGYQENVINLGPKAYWRFGEASGTTAVDLTAKGHDGVYTNSPTLGATSLIADTENTAVGFDGTDDYVAVAADAGLNLSSAWSVGAWINSNGTQAADTGIIAEKYNAGDGLVQYQLGVGTGGNTGDQISIAFYDGSWRQATATLNHGVTVFALGVWDGTDLVLYLNGIEAARSTPGVSAPTANDGVVIAAPNNIDEATPNGFFGGTIDEPVIYGQALTGTEVSDLYAAGTP